jgi:membrane-anchored mycosin MYCP
MNMLLAKGMTQRPVVGIIDSGIAPHPDLPPSLTGYSAVAGWSYTDDTVGHGTQVAGTVAALMDNGI